MPNPISLMMSPREQGAALVASPRPGCVFVAFAHYPHIPRRSQLLKTNRVRDNWFPWPLRRSSFLTSTL